MSAQQAMNRRRLLVQGVISLLALLLLLRAVDLAGVLQLVRVPRPGFFLLACLSLIATHLLHCRRWVESMAAFGASLPGRTLLVSYLTSLPAAQLLPGDWGADVVRITDLVRGAATLRVAAASALTFRLAGLWAALIAASAAVVFVGPPANAPIPPTPALSVIAGVLAVVLLGIPPLAFRAPWLRRLSGGVPADGRRLPLLVLTALGAQALMVLTNWLLSDSLLLGIGLAQLIVAVPLVALASLVPSLPGGLAVKEGAFVLSLHWVGCGSEEALALALANRITALAFGLLGALFVPLRG